MTDDDAAESPSLTPLPAAYMETPLMRVRNRFLENLSKAESLPEAIRSELATLLTETAVPTEAQLLAIITRD